MPNRTHLAALIRADGRSTRQIERDHNLDQGAISYYIAPSSGVSLPKLDVMQYIADALGVPLGVVTQACIRDAGIPTEPQFTAEQVKLITRISALSPEDQEFVDTMVTALETRQDKQGARKRRATRQTAGC